MKKILILLLLPVLTAPLMFAFDWGGNISNYSYATNEDDSYDQVNKFSLWGSHSFDDFTYLTGQGSIGYAKDDYDFLADLITFILIRAFPKSSEKAQHFHTELDGFISLNLQERYSPTGQTVFCKPWYSCR